MGPNHSTERAKIQQYNEGNVKRRSGSNSDSSSSVESLDASNAYWKACYEDGRHITPVKAYGSIDEILERGMGWETAVRADIGTMTSVLNQKENINSRPRLRLITALPNERGNKSSDGNSQISCDHGAQEDVSANETSPNETGEEEDEGGFEYRTARSSTTTVDTQHATKDALRCSGISENAGIVTSTDNQKTEGIFGGNEASTVESSGTLEHALTSCASPSAAEERSEVRPAASPIASIVSVSSSWSLVEEDCEDPVLVTENDYMPNANYASFNSNINPEIKRWSQRGSKVRRNVVDNSILVHPHDTHYQLPPKMLRTFDIKSREVSPNPSTFTRAETMSTSSTVIRRKPSPFVRFKSLSGSGKADVSSNGTGKDKVSVDEEGARQMLREKYEQIYHQGKRPRKGRLRSLVHRASRAFWEEKYKIRKVNDKTDAFNPDATRASTIQELGVDLEDMKEYQRLEDMVQRQRWHLLYHHDPPRCNAYTPIAQDPPSFVPIEDRFDPDNFSTYDRSDSGSGERIYLDGAYDEDGNVSTASQGYLTQKEKKAEVDRAVFWVKDIMGEKIKGDHIYYLVCWWNRPYPRNWSWEDSLWVHAPKAKARFERYRERRESKKVFGIF